MEERGAVSDAGIGAARRATEPGRIAGREIHTGRVVNLFIDTVRFPDGSEGELEMIRHSGAAAVVPLLDPPTAPDPRIILLKQYRYAAAGFLLEIPAGRPERPGEPWELCARRELEEETGYMAGRLVPLTRIFTTPGFTDEVIHLFLALDLQPGTTALDPDEFIEPVTVRFSEAMQWIHSGQIIDAKTICALLFANSFALTVQR